MGFAYGAEGASGVSTTWELTGWPVGWAFPPENGVSGPWPPGWSYEDISADPGPCFVFGGTDAANLDLADNDAYKPVFDVWLSQASFSPIRRRPAGVGGDGVAYSICGYDNAGGVYIADNDAFDPTTNAWTAKADYKRVDDLYLQVGNIENLVYVFTGSGRDVYTPGTDAWAATAEAVPGSNNPGSVAVDFKNAYLTELLVGTHEIHRFNAVSLVYTELSAPAVGADVGGDGVLINSKIYFYRILNNNEYAIATDAWTAKTATTTRRGAVVGLGVSDKAYAFCGSSDGTSANSLDTGEEYDPTTDTWTAINDMPSPARTNAGGAVIL